MTWNRASVWNWLDPIASQNHMTPPKQTFKYSTLWRFKYARYSVDCVHWDFEIVLRDVFVNIRAFCAVWLLDLGTECVISFWWGIYESWSGAHLQHVQSIVPSLLSRALASVPDPRKLTQRFIQLFSKGLHSLAYSQEARIGVSMDFTFNLNAEWLEQGPG